MSPTADRPAYGRRQRWSGLLLGFFLACVLAFVAPTAAGAQDGEPVAVRAITITYVPDDEILVAPILDELDPATVLEIRAIGFEADTTGQIRQCVDDGTGPTCRNRLAVRFDDRGAAEFQFLITDEAAPCRVDDATRCTIELSAGSRRTSIDAVFVDAAPEPGRLVVDPDRNLVSGREVTVRASGFPPAADLTVMVCARPATRGERCGGPGAERDLRTDQGGAATVTFTLDGTSVGAAGVACDRRTRCHLVAVSDVVGVRARAVPLTFRDAPGPSYEPGRLVVGLLVAATLGAGAVWLVRSTDWRPPRESDGTVIDMAVFADLDREAELFEEHEARATAEMGAP